MKKWSIIATGGVVAAFTLGFQATATALPTGAQAHPSDCTFQDNFSNGAMAKCNKSNGGHYKAAVDCTRWDGGGVVTIEAPTWRSSGWSQVYCPSQTTFRSAGITTKST